MDPSGLGSTGEDRSILLLRSQCRPVSRDRHGEEYLCARSAAVVDGGAAARAAAGS
jgi:hypothetical protein